MITHDSISDGRGSGLGSIAASIDMSIAVGSDGRASAAGSEYTREGQFGCCVWFFLSLLNVLLYTCHK